MKKVKLEVYTYARNNGDGSCTIYFCNNKEEVFDLIKESRGKLSDEDKEAIINEDDPYENGIISTDSICLLVSDDGSISLDPTASNSFYTDGI